MSALFPHDCADQFSCCSVVVADASVVCYIYMYQSQHVYAQVTCVMSARTSLLHGRVRMSMFLHMSNHYDAHIKRQLYH